MAYVTDTDTNQQTELLEKNIRGLIILDNVYFLLYVHIKLCSWVKAKVFHLIHNLVEKHPDLNPFYWCLKFLSKQFMDNLWGFYLNCFMISFSSEGMQWMQELEEKVKWGAMWNFIHSHSAQWSNLGFHKDITSTVFELQKWFLHQNGVEFCKKYNANVK